MISKKNHGGNRVIYEYGNHLQKLGHEVIHIVPFEKFDYPLSPLKRLELFLRKRFYYRSKFKTVKPFDSKPEWFPLQAQQIEVPDLSEEYIPDADIVIATAWDTAEWVNSYSAKKGSKFYFVQHHETWGGPVQRVDSTWKLPLKKITIASWLKDEIEQKFHEKVYGVIINGINFEQFYNENKIYHQPRRIGMLYHQLEWKGVKDGLAAFALARQIFPEIKLVLFGVDQTKPGEIPFEIEFHHNPDQEALRKIYCSLDIFLSPSWSEGCQLPPMEAMACKCAVVATNVGGIPDYTLPGETALTAPPHQPKILAHQLITLLRDEKALKHFSEAGYNKIREFTWEKATKSLETVMQYNK